MGKATIYLKTTLVGGVSVDAAIAVLSELEN